MKSITYSQSALGFKPDPVHSIHWTPYLITLGILFMFLLFLAKKSKRLVKTNSQCQLIEKIPLHHKTQAYVVDYQGQRFLIAENQNALAIHPLQEEKTAS